MTFVEWGDHSGRCSASDCSRQVDDDGADIGGGPRPRLRGLAACEEVALLTLPWVDFWFE